MAAVPSPPAALAAFDFAGECERRTGNQLNTTSLLDWEVTAGNVDVLQPGTGDFGIPGGLSSTCFIDLSGNQPAAVRTQTTFDLGPGSFRLTVELAGHNRSHADATASKSTVVSLGANTQTFSVGASAPFSPYSLDIVGPVSGPIVIRQLPGGIGTIGNLLRSVTLEQVS